MLALDLLLSAGRIAKGNRCPCTLASPSAHRSTVIRPARFETCVVEREDGPGKVVLPSGNVILAASRHRRRNWRSQVKRLGSAHQ
jgi:hypothetical protein